MKIRKLLERNGRRVHVIHPTDTVLTAIKTMAAGNIGSLVVVNDDGGMAGIVTERDCMRLVAKEPDGYRTAPVSTVMTREVVVAGPDDRLNQVEGAMHRRGCRHIPVVENGRPIAMISVRDLIRARLEESTTEVEQLREYIQHP